VPGSKSESKSLCAPDKCQGFEYCQEGLCAGIDEAGRGPLAGPVVAAAIIIDPKELIPKIRDSKALNPRVREELYAYLISRARAWAVYSVGPRIIERINILNASLQAMRRAVLKLKLRPKILMVDGPHLIPELDMLQIPLINGDAQCPLIGAASILAKVTRDRIMERYHKLFPQYGFDRHKGYPTREHRQALKQFGPSPIHRRNFRGVGE